MTPSEWSNERLNDLAATVKEFRRESTEQHEKLEGKIDGIASGIVEERDRRADRTRAYAVGAGIPTFIFLLGVIYQLATA